MELTTRDLQLDHLAGLASITWLWAGEEGRQGGRALEEGRGQLLAPLLHFTGSMDRALAFSMLFENLRSEVQV